MRETADAAAAIKIGPAHRVAGAGSVRQEQERSFRLSSRIALDFREIMAVNLHRKYDDLQIRREERASRFKPLKRGDLSASTTVLGQIAEALGSNREAAQERGAA
ncbi:MULTISPECIES: hypothetical protein [Bradyrhizobium]|nr:hypothetical protein [Bradyrhizobium brasilense]